MATHIASKDREPLSGLVERVTFHSPETGFCVLRVCEHCGEIEDLELPLPRGLLTRLQRRHGLTPRRVRIDFYGLCRECSDANST